MRTELCVAVIALGVGCAPGGRAELEETGESAASDRQAEALRLALDGLLYTSETDSAPEVFVIDATPVPSAAQAAAALAPVWPSRAAEPDLEDRDLVEVSLARFFDRLTVAQDWWEEAQAADAVGWREARRVLEDELDGSTVFRFGVALPEGGEVGGAVEVFVVGAAEDGALVGFNVLSVET